MVTDYSEDLLKYSGKLQELSGRYATERMKFGQLESDLLMILATKIKSYTELKKNIGIEMAMLIMVGGSDKDVQKMFADMKKSEHNYKALGVLVEAQQSAIMSIQSIMKYNKTGEFSPER